MAAVTGIYRLQFISSQCFYYIFFVVLIDFSFILSNCSLNYHVKLVHLDNRFIEINSFQLHIAKPFALIIWSSVSLRHSMCYARPSQ